MPKPELAELLGLKNPWAVGLEHGAYNRALWDVWERMEKKTFAPPDVVNIVISTPGLLVWLPERSTVGAACV